MNFRIPLLPLAALAVSCATLPCTASTAVPRVRLEHSVRLATSGSGFHPVRTTLTNTEQAASLAVVVSLRMRNFSELEARLAAGEQISRADMEARYLPLQADYDRVRDWLLAQGLSLMLRDAAHTNVFVRGSVAQIAAAFDTAFGRVSDGTAEFTSALSAPAVPAAMAETVLAINGLQPELPLHAGAPAVEADTTFVHPNRAIPADVLAAYHAPANLDGSGQTIAIVAGDVPTTADLDAFYKAAGLAQTPHPLIIRNVNGGPTVTGASAEASMDVEWSSALAPGAQVMLYATPTYAIPDLLAACTEILNDRKATIVSHSASGPESQYPVATLKSYSQVLAQLAAAGITVLHGSGDNGSNGVPVYPASDPYVTSFGGTTLSFDANWKAIGEVGWTQTGSGVSAAFARPAWQTGPGVPAGTMRCVPDAAALSSTNTVPGSLFPLTVWQGTQRGVGGDSLTGPVWSGFVALINQARATAGLPTVGLLSRRLYPLIGTAALNDITSGSNGAYTAGPGYDLVSGVGSPNVTELVRALTAAEAPWIVTPPAARTVADGSTAVFSVRAGGLPAPTYQWSKDGVAVPGATTAMLVVTASAATAGAYTCAVTNPSGTLTTPPATLALAAADQAARLVNLSILTTLDEASPTFTVGTVLAGSGPGDTKPLLIRAVGPSLAPLGVTGALADPRLDVFAGTAVLASNDNWAGDAALTAAFNRTGAFGFVNASSNDAAVFLPGLAPGAYTVQVRGGAGQTGVALAELYDATPAGTTSTARLINLSVLKRVGATDALTTGFVIAGTAAQTVLIRAIGPRLGLEPFSIAGVMADPQLTLYAADATVLASNDNWGGDAQLSAAADAVGAFSLPEKSSHDAMLLVTLPPGNYTARVNDVAQAGGYVIVEVYAVK